MKKRNYRLFVTMGVCLSLLSNPGVALGVTDVDAVYLQQDSRAGRIHTVSDGGDLRAMLASPNVQDGDIIVLEGNGNVNDTAASASAPWIIDKSVTIRGGNLVLRPGGILLGADVTFEDVSLTFANRVRNAIMANGHTLTLKNVSKGSTGRQVHLLCGGLTGQASSTNAGNHGKIIISGDTSLGNIYAGSLSSDGRANTFSKPATIVIEESASKQQMGEVYASGALESPVDPDQMLNPNYEPDPPTANPAQYTVDGNVTIELYGGVVKNVDGNTGGTENAHVVYNGNEYANSSLMVTNISGLSVRSGKLAPKIGSTFSGTDADVTIFADTELNLQGFGNSLQIGNFNGEGILILGQNQTLTVNGTVSNGTTKVGIGSVFNNASQTVPLKNHTYITAVNSANDSFKLIPHNSDPTAAFTRDGNGNWAIGNPSSSSPIKISNISMPDTVTIAKTDDAEIPVTVDYVSGHSQELYAIPMGISVDGRSANRVGDDQNGYKYQLFMGNIQELEFVAYDTHEALSMLAPDGSMQIAPGEYTIAVTIPNKYMEDGKLRTIRTKLIVTDGVTPPDPGKIDLSSASITVGSAPLVYTGAALEPSVSVSLNGQTLQEGIDYTRSYTNNVNVGTATVTVTAMPNSQYTGTAHTTFTIQKAPLFSKDATVLPKIYDGTTTAAVLNVSFHGDADPNAIVNLTKDRDYTMTSAYNSPNVKEASEVEVNVSLMGDAALNYDLQKASLSIPATISKENIRSVNGQMTVTNNCAGTYTYDLTQLLPDLRGDQSYGTETFKLSNVDLGQYHNGGAEIRGSMLTLPIESVNSDKQGQIGALTVQIITDNYTVSDAVIVVNTSNKKVPQGTPTLSKDSLTYGETLSEIVLSGDMIDADGMPVTGQFVWDEPNTRYPAGIHQAAWTFMPTDSTNYLQVSGTSGVRVDKITPTGVPKYIVITTAGRTLADAGLTVEGGSFDTPGTVKWELPETTVVQANTAYQWIFTPEDADNYNILTGSIVLYEASSGGDGSGGGTNGGDSSGGNGSGGDSNGGGSSGGTGSGGGSNGDGSSGGTGSGGGSNGGDSSGGNGSGGGSNGGSSSGGTGSGGSSNGGDSSGGGSSDSGSKPEQNAGGSTTIETKPDGTVIKTETKKDGTIVETSQTPTGTEGTVITDSKGNVTEIIVKVSDQDAKKVTESKDPIKLPIKVPVESTLEQAPEIKLNVPKEGAYVEIPVTDMSYGTVAVLIHPNGATELFKKAPFTQQGIALSLQENTTIKLVDNKKAFYDVSPSDWYKDAVEFVSAREIMNGVEEGRFNPQQTLSRSMFAMMLHNLENNPKPNQNSQFRDVQRGSWYVDAINWAAEKGILVGYTDGRVGLNERITREQFVVMLYRYAGSPEVYQTPDNFQDNSKVSTFAKSAMEWAISNGIINGKENGYLAPKGQVTRAEAAQMMMHFIS